MTDSGADDDRVAADGRQAAEELTSSSDAGQHNPDAHDQEEASSVAQNEAKDLTVTDGSSESGKRKPDVDVLAKGIASVLGPVMKNFDGGVEGILKSQSILASSIDRLTRELDKLLEDVPHPYATHHATRLSGIRKRVITLNTSLRIIQKRMEMIQRLLAGYASRASTSAHQEKASVKGFHSTSHEASLMEVSPCKVSSCSANNDELKKVEDSETSNISGNLPSGGLQDVSVQEKQDLKDDLVVSPDKEPFVNQEPGGASIARDEAAGESDVKRN